MPFCQGKSNHYTAVLAGISRECKPVYEITQPVYKKDKNEIVGTITKHVEVKGVKIRSRGATLSGNFVTQVEGQHAIFNSSSTQSQKFEVADKSWAHELKNTLANDNFKVHVKFEFPEVGKYWRERHDNLSTSLQMAGLRRRRLTGLPRLIKETKRAKS